MAKSIRATSEEVQQYKELTQLMGLQDLDVVRQEISEDGQQIMLFCLPRFPVDCCPECGYLAIKIHDYPEQRTIHDAPLRGIKTQLVFDVHRLDCQICGHKFTLRIKDVVPNCTYTYRLEKMIRQPERKQSVQTLATIYALGYKTVESIIQKAGEDKLSKRQEESINVKRLGIDEIANRKGQGNYVLVLTDLERRIVLDILPDRKKETLKEWLKSPSNGIELKELESVAIDLWRPYREAVEEVFGDRVNIVADRFHVMQNLHRAIDAARKSEQRGCSDEEGKKKLKGLRYILLKKDDKLKEKDKERLLELEQAHPNLYALTRLRQRFYEWYEIVELSQEEAANKLDAWAEDAQALGYESMTTFCKTITNWKKEIAAFFCIESQAGLLKA